MKTTSLVTLQDALFGYNRRGVVRVQRMEVRAGQCLGIFGPNGSGKTTLVRGLTGLLPPMRGQVAQRAGPALRFGYVAQSRTLDLAWPMSGFDAAAMGVSAGGRFGFVAPAARRRVREAMRRLDVEQLADERFATQSGGQQQRLMLAGALATVPDVLVMDEPADGLDVQSRAKLLDLIRELSKRLPTIMISHDVQELSAVADEIAWLHPSASADAPSEVERVTPDALRDRMRLELGAR